MIETVTHWLTIWGALILSWAAVIIVFGFIGAMLTGRINELKEGGLRTIVELFVFLAKFTLFLLIAFIPPGYAVLFLEEHGYSAIESVIGFFATFIPSVWVALRAYEAVHAILKKYGYRGD